MKICVLQSSYEASNSPFYQYDQYCDPSYFYQGKEHQHTFEAVLVKKSTASQQIRDLVTRGFDVFINLCDGAFDEDRAGIEVVQLLERYNQAFTGADSSFFEPSKETMKKIAYYYGVNTAPFIFAYGDEDIEEAAQNLKFPLIVKHYNGYSSVGMTKNSRCTNREELYFQAQKMIASYGGALIEEFIDGREFTVLVAENPEDQSHPLTFKPVECRFSHGETFKHFDLKWKEYSNIQWIPCDDPELEKKLKDMSSKIFTALGGVGYGRTDIRVNSDNEPFFLEINPNCGIFYPAPEDHPDALGSADFILLNDPMGHVGFIEHIIKVAIEHQKKRVKKTEVRFKHNQGYGVYAKKDIQEGEIIHQHEECAYYLTTRKHVESHWTDPLMREWFEHYAYPMTDNIWAIWSPKPEDWLPINHSCNPNAWLVGLNVAARRPIRKGEQITMEYATFCTDNMAAFNCLCGSDNCRKVIRGRDYLLPFVGDLYDEHISDYVETRRRENAGK